MLEIPVYWDALLPVFVEVMADRVACVAFLAEAAAEMLTKEVPRLTTLGMIRCQYLQMKT